MTWGETWSLTSKLAGDPTSQVGAALAGLAHPIDLTTVVLADLWDLTYKLNVKKTVQMYPRSWMQKKRTVAALSQKVIRAALRARGHDV